MLMLFRSGLVLLRVADVATKSASDLLSIALLLVSGERHEGVLECRPLVRKAEGRDAVSVVLREGGDRRAQLVYPPSPLSGGL